MLTPGAQRRWGKMSAHQMLCHLTDSYAGVIGEREVSPAGMWIPKPILKWLVLEAPMRWPQNVRTRREVAQDGGGTPPGEFERDRTRLVATINRFCAVPDSVRGSHPILGKLTHEEWMRWGYLHADHHLRQFGG